MEDRQINSSLRSALHLFLKEKRETNEKLRLIKCKSFDELNEISFSFVKNADQYLLGELSKIKKLKKLIIEYKELMTKYLYYIQDEKDMNAETLAKKYRSFSQCLYYINVLENNENDEERQNLPNYESDGCILGSIQECFGISCYVFGTEGSVEKKFTGHQGNNRFGMQNDCGIACVTQLLILSGMKVTENDVARTAISEGLCNTLDMNMGLNGATSSMSRAKLLQKYNVQSQVKLMDSERIAFYVEHGHGIIVSVDAGLLWERPSDYGKGHAIVVYGTIHSNASGKIIGFVVCDTGSGNMKQYVSIQDFNRMYYIDRGINVTMEAIR